MYFKIITNVQFSLEKKKHIVAMEVNGGVYDQNFKKALAHQITFDNFYVIRIALPRNLYYKFMQQNP